ncbi:MAG: ribosome assembly factor SBDS [Archaeoglobi archaeon]|jgi:ribosome maturation protein SDO1|nr:ribosome assembly factor SBDS [Archaeoglobus sp.]NHW89256.1 ribosome assembly factor SBDS [Archaeoglobales archaeon]TDA26924.1 MAG: ribosome assembly factor SBDS [Archaeoglobi archaeon]TDA27556.1 MAG: ribosome assembly factor SBDS [Archaeoglobi archaeon]
MVSLEKAVVAKLRKGGMDFEILVDPYLARDLKEGKEVNFDDLLAVEEIFRNARKGERAPNEELQKVFGTTDVREIARTIIIEGEVQITAEQRREMLEAKRKQIVTFLSKNTIDPRTNTPHPPARIERALEEAKVHIDIFKSVEAQIKDIVKALKPILPLKFEEMEVAIKVPPEYAGKAISALYKFGGVTKEEWQRDGSWICLMRIPSGMYGELMDLLGRITKGEALTKILRRIG